MELLFGNFYPRAQKLKESLPLKDWGVFLEDLQMLKILDVLEQCHGNQTTACEILGINRSTLWRRLKRIENS